MAAVDRWSIKPVLVNWAFLLYKPALAAVAYYAAAALAFLIGTLSDRIFAPFWPPNVVLLCVLLLAPARRWPLYFGAIFIAHAAAEAGVGMHAPQMLLAFATNCLVALIGAALLRITTAYPWLGNTRNAALYILITAGIAPAIAAFGGALVPIAGGGSTDHYWLFWGHWYTANALACLTFGPIALTWLGAPDRSRLTTLAEWSWEAVASGALLIAVCLIAMKLTGFVPTSYFPVLLLMPLPIVLWMTFRFGVRGASAANLAVTAILVSHTLDESSPLAASDIETNVLALQLLLTGLSIPILLLGAAIGQTKSMHSAAAMLVGSILKAQDDERREVARELHDNTGQNLVAATLLLGKLQKGTSHPDALSELTGMLQRSIANLRSMSYGLHPPLLDEAGLPLALQSYVGRLKAGCGFSVDIDLPDDIERLPPEIELAFFRLIQETLDTMSRGADDRRARVLLARGTDARAPNVVLTIESESAETSGTFVSRLINLRHRDSLNGMSLAGVSERIHQLGGVVQLQSAAGRVLVKAVVPLD